jgi:hypothetical protein
VEWGRLREVREGQRTKVSSIKSRNVSWNDAGARGSRIWKQVRDRGPKEGEITPAHVHWAGDGVGVRRQEGGGGNSGQDSGGQVRDGGA